MGLLCLGLIKDQGRKVFLGAMVTPSMTTMSGLLPHVGQENPSWNSMSNNSRNEYQALQNLHRKINGNEELYMFSDLVLLTNIKDILYYYLTLLQLYTVKVV